MMQHRVTGWFVVHVIAALHGHWQRITKCLCKILPPRPKRNDNITRCDGTFFRLNGPTFRPFAQAPRITMQKDATLAREEIGIGLRQRAGIGDVRRILVMDRADKTLFQIRLARRKRIRIEQFESEPMRTQFVDIVDSLPKLRLVTEEFDPAKALQQIMRARFLDQHLMFAERILDERQRAFHRNAMARWRRMPPIAGKEIRHARQCGEMIIGLWRAIECIAEEIARSARKCIRIDRGALDDPGIAEARFAAGFAPVDEGDGTPFGLEVQGGTEPDDPGAQNNHVSLHAKFPLKA